MEQEEYQDSDDLPYLQECLFLVDIFRNPVSTVVERYRRLGINPKTGNKWKDFLISRELILPKTIITKSGWTVLFEITEKGRETLRAAGYQVRNNRESIEHIFWKDKIADYYRKQGYDTKVEKERNGNADIIAEKGKKKIAIEIETGNSDYLSNISKNLEAGYKSILCIPTNRHARYKIAQAIERERLEKKVDIILASKFDIILQNKSEIGKI